MAKALDKTAHRHDPTAGVSRPRGRDWRKSMSDNVAWALLVYTGLQIFVTTGVMKAGGMSIMPYIILVLLVAAIIPACRMFERRWRDLSDAAAADPALSGAFRRDQVLLWLMAISLPLVITGAIMGLSAL